MCFQVLPAILSAVGTGAQMVNQNQARRDQDRIAADSLRRNAEANRRGGERVAQEVQRIADSGPEAEQAAAQDDFMAALKQSQLKQGGDALGGPTGGSSRFAEDLDLARTSAAAEGRQLANRTARIDAPQFQRVREGAGFTNTGVDLSLIDDRARGADFLNRLRLARVQPNPGVDALGEGLTAFGGAFAGRARPPPQTGRFSGIGRSIADGFARGVSYG